LNYILFCLKGKKLTKKIVEHATSFSFFEDHKQQRIGQELTTAEIQI
jgi:hypothetical protein